MNQTMYMATRDTLRIFGTMIYAHQKINIVGTDVLFYIDENLAHNTKKCF